jgi:hypothetical protein
MTYGAGSEISVITDKKTDACLGSTNSLLEWLCSKEGFLEMTQYECPNGCKNGACLVNPILEETCNPSWTCIVLAEKEGIKAYEPAAEGPILAYQRQDCAFDSMKECKGGCSGGKCLPEPTPTPAPTATPEEEGECNDPNCCYGPVCSELNGKAIIRTRYWCSAGEVSGHTSKCMSPAQPNSCGMKIEPGTICEYGCKNGKCLTAPAQTPTPEATTTATPTATPQQQGGALDSIVNFFKALFGIK